MKDIRYQRHYPNDFCFIRVGAYEGYGDRVLVELSIRSGNEQNDGLKMNTATVRMSRQEVVALRDELDRLLGEDND